jgi:hypothetical protein
MEDLQNLLFFTRILILEFLQQQMRVIRTLVFLFVTPYSLEYVNYLEQPLPQYCAPKAKVAGSFGNHLQNYTVSHQRRQELLPEL